MDQTYRIHRLDKLNIVIQRKVENKSDQEIWTTVSYHGNSIKSLVSGLLQLVVSKHTPENVKLSEQLKTMELELISSIGNLEKLAEKLIEETK